MVMKYPHSGVEYLQPSLAAERLQGENSLRHILLLDHLGRVPRNGVSWVSFWSADKIPLYAHLHRLPVAGLWNVHKTNSYGPWWVVKKEL